MHRTRRAGRTALAAAIALGVVAVPAAALTAPTIVGGQSQATLLPAAASAGELVLSTTSRVGTVTWDGKTQRFREATQCEIVQDPGSSDLLTITGSVGGDAGTAGFRKRNIGVFEFDEGGDGPSNAAKCSQVDASSFTTTETLGLDLGSEAADAFGSLVATSASVSLVAKSQDGAVAVTLIAADGGQDVTLPAVSWKRLKDSASIKLPGSLGGGEGFTFTGIRLEALKGNFSLRGATFALESAADGILDCRDEPIVLGGDGDAPAVILTRLDNANPAEECEPIPYRLRNDGDEVQFLKPLDEQISAQFILDVVWTVSPANTNWQSADPLLPETTIDYEQGGGEIPLRWCPDVTTDSSGAPTGISGVLSNPAIVDQDELTGTQFTCLVSQNARVVDGEPDSVTVKQEIYLLGDAVYRFR